MRRVALAMSVATATEANVADDNLSLAPTDIVGVIQRGLRELDVYCAQSASNVDPQMIIGYLRRLAEFANRLPRLPQRDMSASDAVGEARAN